MSSTYAWVSSGRDGARTLTWYVADGLWNHAYRKRTVIVDNTAPTVTIGSPAGGQLFSVNGTYTLRGSATDAEDGTVPDASLSWTVIKHHAEHTHPCPLAPTYVSPVGSVSSTVTVPSQSTVRVTPSPFGAPGASATQKWEVSPAPVASPSVDAGCPSPPSSAFSYHE